jgi:hypothetical protein
MIRTAVQPRHRYRVSERRALKTDFGRRAEAVMPMRLTPHTKLKR